MEAVLLFKELYNYTSNDKNKWPFSGLRKDDVFQWYHNWVFKNNIRMEDCSYFKRVKKNYSSLVQVNVDQDILKYGGREWARPPKQRFFFDNLRPLENDTEQYYPGHPEFLSKFVQKGDILLSNFTHLFKQPPVNLDANAVDKLSEQISPIDLIFLKIKSRVFSDNLSIPSLLTTDLELSQDFLAAVAEDNF